MHSLARVVLQEPFGGELTGFQSGGLKEFIHRMLRVKVTQLLVKTHKQVQSLCCMYG